MATTTTNLGLPRPVAADNVTLASQQALIDAIDANAVARSTADIVYYVRTDGNDTNSGLTNTAGGAFLTIGKAISEIPQVVSHTVNVKIASGTYTEDIHLDGYVGKGSIFFECSTPASRYTIKSLSCNASKVRITVFNFITNNFTPSSNSVHVTNADMLVISDFVTTNSDSTKTGLYAEFSKIYLWNSVISNKNQAVLSDFSSSITSENVTGSGNVIGLEARHAAVIGKVSAQPSGTTAEVTSSGGVIR